VSRKIVLGLMAVVSVAACVFLVAVWVGQGLVQASLWAAILAALAAVVAVVVAVWALPKPPQALLPPELEVPDWVVDRPAEMAAVVKALVGGGAGTVGITTGLYGAGGFGKTTLAQMVCADRRVRRRFAGRVHLVTVGRDVRGAAAVAAKINDVIKLVSGEDATFTDPHLAGQQLGSLLEAGPRRLLVLDECMGAGAAVAVHRGQQAMRPASDHTGTGAAGRAGHGGAGRSDVAGAGAGAADIWAAAAGPSSS
jgi:hypothetical protein